MKFKFLFLKKGFLAIQLRVNDEYKDLEELSVGQKATALFIFVKDT